MMRTRSSAGNSRASVDDDLEPRVPTGQQRADTADGPLVVRARRDDDAQARALEGYR
jgi:hypothetical protein